LYALSYHSQLLATPELVPALAHVARKIAADTAVWLATTGEIAEWWRGRSQLDARVTPRVDGFDVTVRNRGERLVSGVVVRVDLPTSRTAVSATTALIPAQPGSARLLLPPIAGKTTRTFQINYAGARLQTRASRSSPRARPIAKKHKRFRWLPF